MSENNELYYPYLQIAEFIKWEIVQGILTPGSRCSSLRNTASKFHVSVQTAQRAYHILENQKIIYKSRTRGYYVYHDYSAFKIELANNIIETFLRRIEGLGYTRKEIIELLCRYKN